MIEDEINIAKRNDCGMEELTMKIYIWGTSSLAAKMAGEVAEKGDMMGFIDSFKIGGGISGEGCIRP